MSVVATFPGYTAIAFANVLKKQERIIRFAQMTCFMITKQVTGVSNTTPSRIVKYQTKQENHPDLRSQGPLPRLT